MSSLKTSNILLAIYQLKENVKLVEKFWICCSLFYGRPISNSIKSIYIYIYILCIYTCRLQSPSSYLSHSDIEITICFTFSIKMCVMSRHWVIMWMQEPLQRAVNLWPARIIWMMHEHIVQGDWHCLGACQWPIPESPTLSFPLFTISKWLHGNKAVVCRESVFCWCIITLKVSCLFFIQPYPNQPWWANLAMSISQASHNKEIL